MLRTLEELDVPLVGADYQSHLLGIHLFMSAPSPTPTSSLRQACFWTGLRQELYMAFVHQRPVITNLDHAFIDRTFEPADDDTWAQRVLVHGAEVTRFCFGGEENDMDRMGGGGRISRWKELWEYGEMWLDTRPESWRPVAYRERDLSRGDVFPEIWYFNHAVG